MMDYLEALVYAGQQAIPQGWEHLSLKSYEYFPRTDMMVLEYWDAWTDRPIRVPCALSLADCANHYVLRSIRDGILQYYQSND